MPEPLPSAAQADHLTDVLRCAGMLGDDRVADVGVESARTTILSRITRLCLSYDGEAPAAPRSIILKTGQREHAETRWHVGRHEVAFYEQIAKTLPAGLVPRCFEAHCDEATREWHLLLEDLTETHFALKDWPLPPTMSQCKRIVAARARLHARWWDDPRLGVSIGTWLDAEDRHLERFAEQVERFIDRLGELLSPERRDFYRRLVASGRRLMQRYHTHRNMTIVHGDAHVWNVFLPQNGDSDDLRIFDWDSWGVDTATDDLAYMMALHWFPAHRRRCERALLDRYHVELLAHGVTGYDRHALDDDYRLSVLWQASTPVSQAAHGIPAVIWWNHLERIFTAIDDLECRALLAA